MKCQPVETYFKYPVNFLEYLNSKHPSIKFTMETEVENVLSLSQTNIGLSAMTKLVDLYEEGSIKNEDKLVFEAARVEQNSF